LSAYRAPSADAAHFTDRQRTWLAATTTEAVARAMLQGIPAGRVPTRAPDELAEVMLWMGVAFTALGAIAAFATSSGYAAIPIAPGALLLASALARRLRKIPPAIVRIRTITPRFQTRTTEDSEVTSRYLLFAGAPELFWPSKLHALADTLSEGEELRVAVVTRGEQQHIEWAMPVRS